MTRSNRALQSATLLLGEGALFAGLWLLATIPLVAVLVILGAMTCVLVCAAGLFGEEITTVVKPRNDDFTTNHKLKGA
jgi:hypothetical protein